MSISTCAHRTHADILKLIHSANIWRMTRFTILGNNQNNNANNDNIIYAPSLPVAAPLTFCRCPQHCRSTSLTLSCFRRAPHDFEAHYRIYARDCDEVCLLATVYYVANKLAFRKNYGVVHNTAENAYVCVRVYMRWHCTEQGETPHTRKNRSKQINKIKNAGKNISIWCAPSPDSLFAHNFIISYYFHLWHALHARSRPSMLSA